MLLHLELKLVNLTEDLLSTINLTTNISFIIKDEDKSVKHYNNY